MFHRVICKTHMHMENHCLQAQASYTICNFYLLNEMLLLLLLQQLYL